MNINVECVPCYFRQALQAAKFATDDQSRWWLTLHRLAEYVAGMGPDMVSHDVAEQIHRIIRETTNCPDPYKQVKDDFNRRALGMLASARDRVLNSPDPLEAAARMAIAGNVIDFGSEAFLDLDTTLENILDRPLAIDHTAEFLSAARAARNILVLGDNAGEIVFDKLLLEQLAGKDITFAVRGAPILNDATPPEARDAGIHDHARIIDHGLAVAGVPLERVSPEFLDAFNSADIIISKGQANFESLCDKNNPKIFFLFTIKCDLVARRTRTKLGDIVIARCGGFEME